MKPRCGYSLVETIIASFILLLGFLVSIRLFNAAINYSGVSQMRGLAVLVGNKKLEEINAWNRSTHQPVGATPFSDWSAYNGATVADAVNPTISTTITTTPVSPLYVPCTTFQAIVPTANQVTMVNCLERVDVQVNWNLQSLTLTSMFAPPPGTSTPSTRPSR